MNISDRPFRSVLYIPGSNIAAMEKARIVSADAIIFDLEDAVSPDSKERSRKILCDSLKAGGFGQRFRIVRINGIDTQWWEQDLAQLPCDLFDAVLLPKVNSTADIDHICEMLPDTVQIWAMIETPLGILNAKEIAAHSRVSGFVAGTNDLSKELNSRYRTDRMPLMTALQTMLLAARAYDVVAVDGVYNQFKDIDGLREECKQGRDLGFDGKSLIHPAQIEVANTEFAPTDEEIEIAKRQIAAFEEIQAQGKGVAVVDGKIVENLHVETAQKMLAKVKAIAALEEVD